VAQDVAQDVDVSNFHTNITDSVGKPLARHMGSFGKTMEQLRAYHYELRNDLHSIVAGLTMVEDRTGVVHLTRLHALECAELVQLPFVIHMAPFYFIGVWDTVGL
jgi:hypothetical protein